MSLDSKLKLPTDTAAAISSQSLLGGKYLSLQLGADDETIAQDGRIQYTQAPQNLEELLGKFIFSMQGTKKEENAGTASPAAASAETTEAPTSLPTPSSDAQAPADHP
jgi:phospholipid/cholesterol/gamma-HCH transport system substrate-binding protein